MNTDLPIGYDNFRTVIEKKWNFVDKTHWIAALIDDERTHIPVFLRPRRFGKTFNLSMLHHFLAAEVNGKPTIGLFDGLKIMQMGEKYTQHQGKYPVVFLTFKDIKDFKFEGAYANLCKLMSRTYTEHVYLLDSSKLLSHQKKVFESILEKRAAQEDIQSALLDLTQALFQHHGMKPWLLIDEYDTPLQAGHMNDYYKPMRDVMQGIFGAALKTNPYLERAVITGILRIAKESLFSGVNNLRVYSMLHSHYAEYFGFTEAEIAGLLKKAKLEERAEEIKEWYNGYFIGETVLYNPWSIANCLNERGNLVPYWVNTSDNKLIQDLLVKSSLNFKAQFEFLLQDGAIDQFIDENIVFADLEKNDSVIWSLLLMTGYLSAFRKRRTDQGLLCMVTIPNKEVQDLYRQVIEKWFSNGHGIKWYNEFIEYLLTGNLKAFEKELRQLVEETVSIHDTTHNPEAFYHGLVMGLTASLSRNKQYVLLSNRESGYGRFDYMIFSKDKNKLSILMEFKKVNAIKNPAQLTTNLEKAAAKALIQVDQKRYTAMVENMGYRNLLKIGLAFSGKHFALCHAYVEWPANLNTAK